MKRLLQLFLAGVFLLSFSAQAGVTSPNGIAKWSGGSSAWLAWTSAGDRVDIRLIPKGSGQEPREIATDIKNTRYYLWQIPDLPKGQYTVEIKGNKPDKSAVFNISAWDEAWDERGVWGEFDEDDRSQVTYPLEAAVLDKDEPITLTWDDYRLFLGDKVTIILKRQGKVSDIEVVPNLPNSGTFDFDKGQITECQKGGCYFVIRNNLSTKKSQQISSHTFTFGTPVTDAFTVEKPEDVTSGKELNIGWTGGTDGHRVRIDLNKGGLFYQTIKESVEASEPNNKYAWPVSLSVLAGEDYAIVVTALADGSSGTSDLFTINLDEDKIRFIGPKNLKVKDKSSRKALRWKGIQAAVDIDLYRDGRRFRAIKRGQSKKLFRWTYGDIPIGENYQIRITQTDDDSVYGISAPFAIAVASASDSQTARLGKSGPGKKANRKATCNKLFEGSKARACKQAASSRVKLFDYLIADANRNPRTTRRLELARNSSNNGLLLCKVSPDREDIPFCNEKKSASKVDWDKWSTGPGNELLQDIEKYYRSTVRFDVGD